ncbi:hypothetical protein LY90DRAFT_432482 [Neocallimastix californiae]|uniref:CBM10 domain-containing protein n=1 Tax=Neocallimastix californiae TaxID=1754190 RepID=A0A1Y2AF12_9FUNG|nr:hypothetical protein LY90DRAFT_432482 [Neocallimastix californiae]|eukprot:ORY21183.1 hypothetical protein LY90DRAFT_432482 [Neocallimastix californiae]
MVILKKNQKTKTTKKAEPTEEATSCWAKKLGYDCCTGCNSVYSDESGEWGFENDKWCGIVENCKSETSTCTGYPDFPCCKGCDVAFSDTTGDWGVENNEWCGIKSTCKGSSAAPDTCFSEPDYPCCTSCNVVETDGNQRYRII